MNLANIVDQPKASGLVDQSLLDTSARNAVCQTTRNCLSNQYA
jgi:hypothetical protein